MFIKEGDLFHGLPSHIIDEVARLAVEESYPAGHLIFEAGDFAESLYILEEGIVALNYGAKGKDPIIFAVNEPGNIFGWSALVEPNRYTAVAKCVGNSKVIRLDGVQLEHVFERHPHEGFIVMRRLAGIIASRIQTGYQQEFRHSSEPMKAMYV